MNLRWMITSLVLLIIGTASAANAAVSIEATVGFQSSQTFYPITGDSPADGMLKIDATNLGGNPVTVTEIRVDGNLEYGINYDQGGVLYQPLPEIPWDTSFGLKNSVLFDAGGTSGDA